MVFTPPRQPKSAIPSRLPMNVSNPLKEKERGCSRPLLSAIKPDVAGPPPPSSFSPHPSWKMREPQTVPSPTYEFFLLQIINAFRALFSLDVPPLAKWLSGSISSPCSTSPINPRPPGSPQGPFVPRQKIPITPTKFPRLSSFLLFLKPSQDRVAGFRRRVVF